MQRSIRDLDGSVAVVTGAAGGLGAAIARRLSEAGAKAVMLDIDRDRLHDASSTIGGSLPIVCDITSTTTCDRAIREVVDLFGAVDVLVNNAGMTHRSAFVDTNPDVIRRVMEVNYFGAVNITKAALSSLIERSGAIAVVSSIAGIAPVLGRTGYAGSKHALHGFYDTLRAELRPSGVDVTMIAPTFVETRMQDRALGGDGRLTDHPQSRVGSQVTPEEVADRTVRAIERRKRMVVIGGVGHSARVMTAIAPSIYERMMVRSLRSELDR